MEKLHLECKPDECLVKTLGLTKKEVKHHKDKGRVCFHLKRNEKLIGLVDEDPDSAQPTYFKQITFKSEQHKVREFTDAKNKNRLIVLCPKLEDWVINVCKANKVKVNEFGLSDKPSELHREINKKLAQFESLINHLQNDKKAPELLHLKSLLR